jgi:hypothetical protein
MGDGRWELSGRGAVWWYKKRGSVLLFAVSEGLIPTFQVTWLAGARMDTSNVEGRASRFEEID